jgi:hypothetical protein
MKNKIIICLALFSVISSATLKSQAYEKGQLTGDFTTGFIGIYGASNFAVRSIPLCFAAEYGFHEYLSAGVYASAYSMLYKPSFINAYRVNYIPMGFRASVHLTDLINQHLNLSLSATEIDLYGGAHAGLVFNNSRRWVGNTILVRQRAFPIVGLYAGARYYFKDNLAGVFEFGATPNGIFNFGLTFRLKGK